MAISKNHQGLTLVELVIGMAVASIIFVAASSVYVYIVRSSRKVSQNATLSQTSNDLIQEFTNHIRWGGADMSIYSLNGTNLFKNSTQLNPDSVKITQFTPTQITVQANPSAAKTYQIIIGVQDKVSLKSDLLTITATQRATTFNQDNPTPTP